MASLDLIGLVAADLDASAAFYQKLGVEFPEPLDPEGLGHVEATLPGGIRFALDSLVVIQSFDPSWTPPSGGQRVGIAFLCDSPQEVDDLYSSLMDEGTVGHKPPWDAPWGQRYAQVKDPDGNVVDLFAWT